MNKLIIVLVLLLALAGMVAYLKYAGVTHEDLNSTVRVESSAIRTTVDDRCSRLDQKLDRMEGKLDKLLEIANRPLPDNLQPAN